MERAGTSYLAAKEPGLKLVVDAGFSCPHGRCTFCDNAAFHPTYSASSKSISQQLDEGIAFHAARGRSHGPYLAYFQSFSNTFAPLAQLQEAYAEALAQAVASSQDKAQAMANAAGVKLGEVVSIVEGYQNTSFRYAEEMEMDVASSDALDAGAGAAKVSPGEVSIEAQVTVGYAID
jgi:hypothetical protein